MSSLDAKQKAIGDEDRRVAEIAEAYLMAREEGRAIDTATILNEHPELAARLRPVFSSINAIESLVVQEGRAAGPHDTPLPNFEDFELVRELGRGGMGIVYEANQKSLSRRVALKVLPLASLLASNSLARFRNEALATAQIDHPNIIKVHSVGFENGIHFYVMQLIEGETLEAIIAAMRASNETGDDGCDAVNGLSAAATRELVSVRSEAKKADWFLAVARIGVQAAEALHHAHQQGIVHRDIKPSNLLIDQVGNVHVSDFGLASIQGSARLTTTGNVPGTLRYMSPEQLAGQMEAVDHRTDIWSLGATLYELLTCQPVGDLARQANAAGMMRDTPIPWPSRWVAELPRDLETIVMTCLEWDKTHRYRSAGELAEDLHRFRNQLPVLASRPGLLRRFASWNRRNRWFVVTALSTVALLLVGLIISSILIYRAYDRARTAEIQLTVQNEDLNQALTRARQAEQQSNAANTELVKVLARADAAETTVSELPDRLFERAEYFFENKQYQAAIDLYTVAMDLAPALLPQGHLHRARAYMALWDFEAARREATLCLDAFPDKSHDPIASQAHCLRLQATLSRVPPAPYHMSAVNLGESWRYWSAADIQQMHLDVAYVEGSTLSRLEQAKLICDVALVNALQSPFGNAAREAWEHLVAVVNEAVAAFPDDSHLHSVRLVAVWQTGDNREFLASWKAWREKLVPQNEPIFCCFEAMACLFRDDADDARRWYHRALRRCLYRSTGPDHVERTIRNALIGSLGAQMHRPFDAWNDSDSWLQLYRRRVDSTDLMSTARGPSRDFLEKQVALNEPGRTDWTPVTHIHDDPNNGVHLIWRPAQSGHRLRFDRLRFEFVGSENPGNDCRQLHSGANRLCVALTQSYDFGIVQVWWNGRRLGEPIDLYAVMPCQLGEIDLGVQTVVTGNNVLEFEMIGANSRARGNIRFGIDYVDFWPEGFEPGRTPAGEASRRLGNFQNRLNRALFGTDKKP